MSDDLIKISQGTIYDPANGIDGEVRDIWVQGGRIVAAPSDPGAKPTRIIDAKGLVVMPGGIDMHCHIAGPKVNVARKMRPEEKRKAEVIHRTDVTHSGTMGSVPARLPRDTSMPAWATQRLSTPRFLRLAHVTLTKSLTTRPA